MPRGDKFMSYTISTLLTRNLHDVFGENDPARRRAAIDEIFTEDCAFYDPSSGVYRGRDEIDRIDPRPRRHRTRSRQKTGFSESVTVALRARRDGEAYSDGLDVLDELRRSFEVGLPLPVATRGGCEAGDEHGRKDDALLVTGG